MKLLLPLPRPNNEPRGNEESMVNLRNRQLTRYRLYLLEAKLGRMRVKGVKSDYPQIRMDKHEPLSSLLLVVLNLELRVKEIWHRQMDMSARHYQDKRVGQVKWDHRLRDQPPCHLLRPTRLSRSSRLCDSDQDHSRAINRMLLLHYPNNLSTLLPLETFLVHPE
jgi:hypothetical protein